MNMHDDDSFDGAFDEPAVEETPKVEEPKEVTEEKPAEIPVEAPVKVEEKPEEAPKPEEVKPTEDEPVKTDKPEEKVEDAPVDPDKKEDKLVDPEKPVEAPVAPAEEPAKPLTKEDILSTFSDLQAQDRESERAVEVQKEEVMKAYYPEGLSNTLVDEASGKPLKSPQDVVDASNGQMSTEEAAQWLMNEQYKLDQDVSRIEKDIAQVAETTVNFKRDSFTVLKKYEPLFKEYPHIQQKVYDKLMKQVKSDPEKGVILSAPDVLEHYDDYLEPYMQAYESKSGQPATAPVTPAPAPAPAPTPSAEDRMDVSGDGGISPVDDPNDFGQQVTKELAREM